MEPTLLHVAIDSFAIQAERLRCPKLVGRPLVLAPADSSRPRVVAVSREARGAGIFPGTPLLVARRLCRDLIALPPDRDLYAGLSQSIHERLAPFAPFADAADAGGPGRGRFALDLTGLARTHAGARDRASAAGREVERAFAIHPTLGIAATRLVSRVAATVLAPDGELLDVMPGSEVAFLAPLAARLLPASRRAAVAPRLDLLNVRAVRDVQALDVAQLRAAFGAPAGLALWREARGLDAATEREGEPSATAVAEDTLGQETNDGRILGARLERLAMELGVGLRARGTSARSLAVTVWYADGREGRAKRTLATSTCSEAEIRTAALAVLDRALTRRVRVRRLRLEAWEAPSSAAQLSLWDDVGDEGGDMTRARVEARREAGRLSERAGHVPTLVPARFHNDNRAAALEAALDRVRASFGTGALVPAAWMAYGVALRPPARP